MVDGGRPTDCRQRPALDDTGDSGHPYHTNREVLAVDQDKLGKGGARIASNGDTEVWARPLEDGGWAVALFNRGEMPNPVSIAWSTMQLKRVESVRDVWTHASVKPGDTGFDTVVPSHGVVMVRVTGR